MIAFDAKNIERYRAIYAWDEVGGAHACGRDE
jgi:hypothetical protein